MDGSINPNVWHFMIIAVMVIGFYLIGLGAFGSKKLSHNFPEEVRERASGSARIFYIVLGLDVAVCAFFEFVFPGSAVYSILISAPIIIIGFIVIFFKKYGKAIREAEEEKERRGR